MSPSPKNSRVRGHLLGIVEHLAAGEDLSLDVRELVNRIVFPPSSDFLEQIKVCVILGSGNCGYRVSQAFSVCEEHSASYVVSGGALMESGETEAGFMRDQLRALGVDEGRIQMDESSLNTAENLRHALPLIEAVTSASNPSNVVLVTGGFHVVRTMDLARRIFADSPRLRVFPLAANGPNTAPNVWHLNPRGRAVIGAELEKICNLGLLPEGV